MTLDDELDELLHSHLASVDGVVLPAPVDAQGLSWAARLLWALLREHASGGILVGPWVLHLVERYGWEMSCTGGPERDLMVSIWDQAFTELAMRKAVRPLGDGVRVA